MKKFVAMAVLVFGVLIAQITPAAAYTPSNGDVLFVKHYECSYCGATYDWYFKDGSSMNAPPHPYLGGLCRGNRESHTDGSHGWYLQSEKKYRFSGGRWYEI